MAKRRNRELAGPAIVLAGAGVVTGAVAVGVFARRRRRGIGAPMERSKLIVKRLFEEPWQGSFEAIDEFVSTGYIGHDPAEPEPIRGPAGVRANAEKYIAAFPGGAITVDEQIVEGDRVATRWTGRGTHTGELAGVAPTGKDVTVSGLTISRFHSGKVVEEWTTWDTLGLLVQLGAVGAAQSEVR
ncbi:MAG TPA: ester cyclase [Gaiellaceae bacterium]|nr:ester cyclase [Gaiellaceae bacterium]